MDAPQEARERLRARLKMRLAELLDGAQNGAATQPKMLKEQLRALIKTLPPKEHRFLQLSRFGEEEQFLQQILDETFSSDLLNRLMTDETVSEIMINGPSEIFVERDGHLTRVEGTFHNQRHLMAVVERLLDAIGQSVNESNPVCDASLPDGSRLNVIIAPLVVNGPVVTIRRRTAQWTMDEYIARGALTAQAAEFLRACVLAKVNMILCGGTSTGKTTLVSVLSTFIPADQRVITIENVAELELPGREHWIRLVGKSANIEGRGEIPLRVLVRNALRMRPDRIILGEARGGEAFDVVQAMHTGHDGFMTVLHASNTHAALERLQTLMLMSGLDLPTSSCQMQIASAVDLVIHVSRFVDGSRRVSAISQVLGASRDGFVLEDLFAFDMEGFSSDGRLRGAFRYTGAAPKFLAKFQMNNVEVPAWLTK